MSAFNIEVAGGSSVLLPTAGKYCPDDIIVTATGGDIDALIDGSITEISSGVTKIFDYALVNRTKIKNIVFPKASSIGLNAVTNCCEIISADFSNLMLIKSYAFSGSRSLRAFILRTKSICDLSNKNAFDECYHILGTQEAKHNPNGDKDGYFYVPRALVDGCKSATNWSEFASQFRALEDFTVDGTITGALDWDKVAKADQEAKEDTAEYLFKDEYIDSNARGGLPSMEGNGFIGKTFTLVVNGVDIATKVYNGIDENSQWIIGSGEYQLVFEFGKEDVWFTTGSGFTCSLRIDN